MNFYKISLFTILILCFQILSSDIVPENSHHIRKCLKFNNINDFPGFSIISVVSFAGHIDGMNSVNIVKNDECIYKGYKFNQLRFYAINNNLLNKNRSLENIDFEKINENLKPIYIEDCEGGYIDNKDKLQNIETIYKISEITDSSIIVYKHEEIKHYPDEEIHMTYSHPRKK